MAEKKFADGFIVKKPHEKDPAFVIGRMSIKVSEATAFLAKHQDNDWVNLDILESRDGAKYYMALNDYKPTPKEAVVELAPDETPF